ncbi:MAG: hypothetical protein HZA68_20255 [Rhodovulum sp.]|nr:hypothetical protein [Rhodovulum sp.]
MTATMTMPTMQAATAATAMPATAMPAMGMPGMAMPMGMTGMGMMPMMMNPMMMCRATCTMTETGMTCEITAMDAAMKDMVMQCCQAMCNAMAAGMPMMMACGGMTLCCMPMKA